MSDCKHERYSYGRPDAYCPDCDVSWEIVERDQRIAELESVKEFSAAAVNELQADNLALCRQVTKLEAENQRLREALNGLARSGGKEWQEMIDALLGGVVAHGAAAYGGGENE